VARIPLDPAVFFIGLLISHNLVNENGLITRIKEYGITIGHLHPVPFFWYVEPFYIPMCMRRVGKTINRPGFLPVKSVILRFCVP
jgi:hypothetical protein